MSHNIYFDHTGQACIASYRQNPWHKLGVVFHDEVDGSQLLKLARLDWRVEKAPIWVRLDDGREFVDPNHRAVVRSDSGDVFGIVGENYEIFQNDEMIGVFEEIRKNISSNDNDDTPKFVYEVAGAIRNSRSLRVWVLARVPDLDFNIKGDVVRQYLLITSTHDGTGSLTIIPTAVRVVCQNTINLAFSKHRRFSDKGISFSIKHTKNMRLMISRATAAIKDTVELNRFNRQIYQALAETPASQEMKEEFFGFIVDYNKDEKKRIEGSQRAESIRENKIICLNRVLASATNRTDATDGTAWGLLQAGVEYVDFFARTRVTAGNLSEFEQRFDSAQFGAGSELKAAMQDKIVELAGVSV